MCDPPSISSFPPHSGSTLFVKLDFKLFSNTFNKSSMTNPGEDRSHHVITQSLPSTFDLAHVRVCLLALRDQTNTFLTEKVEAEAFKDERKKEREYISKHQLAKAQRSGSATNSNSDVDHEADLSNDDEDAEAICQVDEN
ncbi:hypothetical protein CROQUDRAFT_282217 [Cronartium quercuum f. sp. fusiforme G11]|uniref:Uncharacterized protein n=1 Tax=Cronartium quercuum f. sp. fusiforme G11 TaxID=708437 RepID=A0A9P6NCC1_9BASI|nr:hypothetical protein CROQUDRAFT_282217 [Cronartium quercuum f. sp. fusiforme G11]